MAGGTITDPGALANAAPPNETELVMFDVYGDTARQSVGVSRSATTAQSIAIMQAVANMSQAGILSAGIKIRLQASGTATSAPNDAVSTKAIFVFQDPVSRIIAKYQIPAPLASNFLVDNITIDTTQTDVIAFRSALSAVGEYSNGTSIIASGVGNQLSRAYRYQKHGTVHRIALVRE